jgi:hypothetical protein
MQKYNLDDLQNILNKNNTENDVFSDTLHINFSNDNIKRVKGVETMMFECENGSTLLLEKDCNSDKILNIEIIK